MASRIPNERVADAVRWIYSGAQGEVEFHIAALVGLIETSTATPETVLAIMLSQFGFRSQLSVLSTAFARLLGLATQIKDDLEFGGDVLSTLKNLVNLADSVGIVASAKPERDSEIDLALNRAFMFLTGTEEPDQDMTALALRQLEPLFETDYFQQVKALFAVQYEDIIDTMKASKETYNALSKHPPPNFRGSRAVVTEPGYKRQRSRSDGVSRHENRTSQWVLKQQADTGMQFGGPRVFNTRHDDLVGTPMQDHGDKPYYPYDTGNPLYSSKGDVRTDDIHRDGEDEMEDVFGDREEVKDESIHDRTEEEEPDEIGDIGSTASVSEIIAGIENLGRGEREERPGRRKKLRHDLYVRDEDAFINKDYEEKMAREESEKEKPDYEKKKLQKIRERQEEALKKHNELMEKARKEQNKGPKKGFDDLWD